MTMGSAASPACCTSASSSDHERDGDAMMSGEECMPRGWVKWVAIVAVLAMIGLLGVALVSTPR